MFPFATKVGFADELSKIGEFNLSGIKAETLLSYPKPEPMPSSAYEKAQQILQKATPITKQADAIRPDQMPNIQKLVGKKKKNRRETDGPPPNAIDKAKSVGGHALAGAGAGKFLHGWGDSVRLSRLKPQTTGRIFKKTVYPQPASPKSQAVIMTAGAGLGLAELGRKKLRKHRWEKEQEKKAEAFPSTGHATPQFLGKPGPTLKTLAPKIGRKGVLP